MRKPNVMGHVQNAKDSRFNKEAAGLEHMMWGGLYTIESWFIQLPAGLAHTMWWDENTY